MKCPSDILKTFDFDKIVLKLCSLAVCPVTRELLARLEPAPTVEEANQRLTTVQVPCFRERRLSVSWTSFSFASEPGSSFLRKT
ncbi:MAG: hypothetical protein NTX88_08375 [Candidatus Atribacteria bacterium]|nr:hypothetical protein [Candidatus Atribacteria bacterium]